MRMASSSVVRRRPPWPSGTRAKFQLCPPKPISDTFRPVLPRMRWATVWADGVEAAPAAGSEDVARRAPARPDCPTRVRKRRRVAPDDWRPDEGSDMESSFPENAGRFLAAARFSSRRIIVVARCPAMQPFRGGRFDSRRRQGPWFGRWQAAANLGSASWSRRDHCLRPVGRGTIGAEGRGEGCRVSRARDCRVLMGSKGGLRISNRAACAESRCRASQ